MDPNHIPCGCPECANAAVYKIAAPWRDGRFSELKTYGLACLDHFGDMFRRAQERRRVYVTTLAERVGEIGIYRIGKGEPDFTSLRLKGLEEACRSWERAERER